MFKLSLTAFALVLALAARTATACDHAQDTKPLPPFEAYQSVIAYMEGRYVGKLPADWERFKKAEPKTADTVRTMIAEAFNSIGDPNLKVLSPAELAEFRARVAGGRPKPGGAACCIEADSNLRLGMALDRTTANSWLQIRMTNLDYTGLGEHLDVLLREFGDVRGVVLDMRGASGQCPQIATTILSRFLPQPPLAAIEKRHQNVLMVQDYDRPPTPPATVYGGTVIVLVDGQTTGSAEAIARRLQQSGRALIRGVKTSGSPTFVAVREYRFTDGQSIALQIPNGRFVIDGQPVAAVSPDRYDPATIKADRFFDTMSMHAREDMLSWFERNGVGLGVFTTVFVLGLFWLLHSRRRG